MLILRLCLGQNIGASKAVFVDCVTSSTLDRDRGGLFLTRLGVEELGLGPPNWFGGVGLESPPEKEKPIYFVNF